VLGGDRNPFDFWDFFDVTGDASINLKDALLILAHFGHGPNDDATDDLLDRYAPDPLKPYRTAAALSATGINLSDALLNLQSFGHSCAATP
jgi:hypothetical protein